MTNRSFPLFGVIAATIVLAGCSSPENAQAPAMNETTQSAANGVDNETTSTPSTRAASSDAPTELPLTPAVYVLEGTSCENPANAAWRIWNGEGLSGSATKACRAEILSQSGDDYTIRNSCVNTYDGSRTPEELTVTVVDQVHFAIEGNRFASCSNAQVPDTLRRILVDGSL